MKRLLELIIETLIDKFDMTSSPKRKASKSITQIEKLGGYLMKCGCLVHINSIDVRRLLNNFGPEFVLDLENQIKNSHTCVTQNSTEPFEKFQI